MPQPRPAPVAGSVSPYVTECKLIRAYDRLLRAADLDALIAQAFGPKLSPSKAAAADERLQYTMPELIRSLKPEQQPALVELLLCEAPDLPAAVRELVRLENGAHRRDEDPRLKINDDARLKAAGMGRLSRQQYEYTKPKYQGLGAPLVLEPLRVSVRKPALRAKKRRVARKPALWGQYSIWPPVSGGGVLAGGL